MQSTTNPSLNYSLYPTQDDNSSPTQKSISCLICGCEFGFSSELEVHVESSPCGGSMLSSTPDPSSMPKSYVDPSSVPNSYVDPSSGIVVYTCEFCEYKAPIRKDMIRHRRKHTGERPFKCRFCPYRGSQKSNVIRHERVKH